MVFKYKWNNFLHFQLINIISNAFEMLDENSDINNAETNKISIEKQDPIITIENKTNAEKVIKYVNIFLIKFWEENNGN